uniref:Uncharacterized protein n=1 Tax=Tanacetum cinerariifolium TaxID=118510 RepID=A0A6L2KFZ9_TANCI|nr:hypothetical protein [Tanacetum cinerariifolium]
MAVSDFISKCCLKEAFTRAPTQYKEYLIEFWYTTKTLDNSNVWVSTPTSGVRGEICITNFRNALKAHYLPHSTVYVSPPSITTLQNLPHKLRRSPKAKSLELQLKSEAKDHQKIHLSPRLRHINPKLANPKLKLNGKDKILSHPSPPTPMVGEMHKEPQQAASGLTSLGATSEEGAHPQLSSNSIAKADHGPSAPNDSIPPQQGMDEGTKNTPYDHIFAGSNLNVLVDKSKYVGDGLKTIHTESSTSEELGADEISKKIKLEDLMNLLKDTRFSFFTPDSPPDEPINVSDESDQEEVAELKNTQWELQAKFLDLPRLASSVQEKLMTLDSLPGLLKMVTNTLNRFATLVENTSGATTTGVPSVDKAAASPAGGIRMLIQT